jgi:hypothetical protein
LCGARKTPQAAPAFESSQGDEFIAESAASAAPIAVAACGASVPEELRPNNYEE